MVDMQGLRLARRATIESLALFQVLHRGDMFIAEESKVRQSILKFYAHYEVGFLKFNYWLLDRTVVRNSKIMQRFLYLTIAKFLGERFIAGQCMTWDEVEGFVDNLPDNSAIAVGPCRCRVATKACDHPLETDIVILTGTPIWTSLFPDEYRTISKQEALEIMGNCRDLGMVQSVFRNMYFRGSSNYFVICNCCACSCVPLIGYHRFKEVGFHYIPGEHVSSIDIDICEGCGKCVEVCPFRERSLVAGKAQAGNCMGCEVCVRFCPSGASTMVPAAKALPRAG